jgi:hypothetical protein
VIVEQQTEQDDEVPTCAPPADEVVQEPVSLIQQREDEVGFFSLQNSDNIVSFDSKYEEEKKALNEDP